VNVPMIAETGEIGASVAGTVAGASLTWLPLPPLAPPPWKPAGH
jgi:hypothetical protein